MKIILDLDGVLADFDKAMREAHGYEWHIPGHQQPWDTHTWTDLTAEQWWEPANNYGFWAGLDWTEDGSQILELAQSLVPMENICIVTSPSLSPESASGKMAWIQREIPELSRQFFIGSAKQFLAGPDAVLLDDFDGNITAFEAAGGNAVTVPRQWNHLFPISHGKSLAYVTAKLHYMKARLEAQAG